MSVNQTQPTLRKVPSGEKANASSRLGADLTKTQSPRHKKEEPELLVNADPEKKWRSWRVRFWSTWAMLGLFIFLMYLGHPALLALVFVIQSVMFKEIVGLGNVISRENKLPGFRHLQWFWYLTAQFFIYSRLFREVSPAVWQWGAVIFSRINFISFTFYVIGVVGFVFSLKKGHYKYQFSMFAWCHLTLLMVVIQSSFLLNNMFQGLIWFVMPALLIISSDVWAYFFGFFWGRTPLIKLSPKKTWEGFIGATVVTLITGFWLARVLSMYDFLICPKNDLSFSHASCVHPFPFLPIPYELPTVAVSALKSFGLDWTYVTIMPVQWHGVAIAAFASIIAPFGGFFASGFKRAFKIKDFGESIPGHGGVTDRMDCQIMMGLFSYVYYNTFVVTVSDASTLVYLFSRMAADEQIEAFLQLQTMLASRGALSQLAQLAAPTPTA